MLVPRMSKDLTSRVVSPRDLTPDELSTWDDLCTSQSRYQSPFFSPHFARALASVREGVSVCVMRREGRPVGFLPFQYATRWHRLLGSAEPIGEPMNDYFGLIAEESMRTSVQQILQLTGLSHLGFTHLEEEQLSMGLEAERPEAGLRIQLPGLESTHWEQLRRSDKKLVEDTERRQRKLEAKYGPLSFRFSAADSETLGLLIEMKRRQYQSTNVDDVFKQEWRRRLLQVLAETKHATCTGVLSVLYAGETWVASHFGLRSASTLHYWFPVYNPALREFAPGRVLLKHVCNAGPGEGIRCIDRGAGDTQAKREIANERHFFYRGAWFRPGSRSTIVRAMSSVQWRLDGIAAAKENQRAASEERAQ